MSYSEFCEEFVAAYKNHVSEFDLLRHECHALRLSRAEYDTAARSILTATWEKVDKLKAEYIAAAGVRA
jgi:hypothetical protein